MTYILEVRRANHPWISVGYYADFDKCHKRGDFYIWYGYSEFRIMEAGDWTNQIPAP